MEAIVHVLEVILTEFVELEMVVFELLGTVVIAYSAIKGFINYARKKRGTKLMIAEGFSMGLELLMGGEILKTVTVPELSSILFVGGIIVLRVALTLLLHWEMKHEKEEDGQEKSADHR